MGIQQQIDDAQTQFRIAEARHLAHTVLPPGNYEARFKVLENGVVRLMLLDMGTSIEVAMDDGHNAISALRRAAYLLRDELDSLKVTVQ